MAAPFLFRYISLCKILFHRNGAGVTGAQVIVIFPGAGDVKTERPTIARLYAFAGVKSTADTATGCWI